MISTLLRLSLIAAAACIVLLVGALALGAALPADEIAFDAAMAHGREIFMLDAGRGLFARITFDGGRGAAWSPDGRQIAYIGPAGTDGQEGLYLLEPGGQPRLLREVRVQGETRAVDWSPDGRQLALASTGSDVQTISLLDVATGARRQITVARGNAFAPAWSPQGLIAFSWSPVPNAEIYTLPASEFTLIDSHSTAPNPQRITANPYTDSAPDWSPDGQWLAFVSDRTGGSNIYLMRPDGSDLHPVQITRGADSDPSWSPDGQRLAFVSSDLGVRRLMQINSDGSDREPLAAFAGRLMARPAWRPRLG